MNPLNHPINASTEMGSTSVCPTDFFAQRDDDISNLFFDEVDLGELSSSTLSIEEKSTHPDVQDETRRRHNWRTNILYTFILVLFGAVAGLSALVISKKGNEVHSQDIDRASNAAKGGIRSSARIRNSPQDIAAKVESTDIPSSSISVVDYDIDSLAASDTFNTKASLSTSSTLSSEYSTHATTTPYFRTTQGTPGMSSTAPSVELPKRHDTPPTKDNTQGISAESSATYSSPSPYLSSTTTMEFETLPNTVMKCSPSLEFQQNLLPNTDTICDDCIPQVSLDGSTAVVKYDDKIYFYFYKNGIWDQAHKTYYIGTDETDLEMPIAISGQVTVAGDYENGAAYVIDKSLHDQPQHEVFKLEPPEEIGKGAEFGYSVDVHANRMIVGAPYGQGKSAVGSAYVYRRVDHLWILDADFDSTSRHFGENVAIGENMVAVKSGDSKVFLFEYDPTLAMWKELQDGFIHHSDHTGNDFGASLAFTDDNGLIVGCPGENALYYYGLSNGKYILIQKITSLDGGPDDFFGDDISVSGNTMVVGAPGAGKNGRAYVFTRTMDTWNEAANIRSPFREASFGYSVALSESSMIISSENGAYFYSFNHCS